MTGVGPSLSCAHNAEAQVLLPGRKTQCRKCGAWIEPEQGSVTEGNAVQPGDVRAVYPASSR